MTIATLVLFAMLALAALCCSKLSHDISEEIEHTQADDPCEGCLRWEECSGVDEQCPLLQED